MIDKVTTGFKCWLRVTRFDIAWKVSIIQNVFRVCTKILLFEISTTETNYVEKMEIKMDLKRENYHDERRFLKQNLKTFTKQTIKAQIAYKRHKNVNGCRCRKLTSNKNSLLKLLSWFCYSLNMLYSSEHVWINQKQTVSRGFIS